MRQESGESAPSRRRVVVPPLRPERVDLVTDEALERYGTRVSPAEFCGCPDFLRRRVVRGQVCKHLQALIDRLRTAGAVR